MKYSEKVILESIKTIEDEYIGKFFADIQKTKSDLLSSTAGLTDLISGSNSIFNAIKNLIGPFLTKITNSINIINNTKNEFLNKIGGVDKIPKDLT